MGVVARHKFELTSSYRRTWYHVQTTSAHAMPRTTPGVFSFSYILILLASSLHSLLFRAGTYQEIGILTQSSLLE